MVNLLPYKVNVFSSLFCKLTNGSSMMELADEEWTETSGQTHMAELYEKVTENWLNFWGIPYSLPGFLSGFVAICFCPALDLVSNTSSRYSLRNQQGVRFMRIIGDSVTLMRNDSPKSTKKTGLTLEVEILDI